MGTLHTRQFAWMWQGVAICVGVDETGEGRPVLCLPAPSSISTRREMRPLMEGLAAAARLIDPDWPGFGDQPRPAVHWTPDAFSTFLAAFVESETPSLHATIAAGHAASYALHFAAANPGRLGRLVLLAPTWRGPLPTVFGGDRPVLHGLQRAIDAPLIGPLLYRLNVNPFIARMMVAGHVHSAKRPIAPDKQAVMRAPGARFASGAFVTGGLDRFGSRTEFLDIARRAGAPILLAYGRDTPPKSRAEMEWLAQLPGVQSIVLPRGKLGLHEEFAADLVEPIRRFLA